MQSTDDINLNDIADELLIVDKRTIEHLFELENCADCVAIYMFFYKTAKWQGTRSIKANDTYIRKCLGWGARKVTATKKILESAGLIKKVARRKDGKIVGHFIEVAYLLNQNTRNPLVDETTCGFGETNAYRTNIKCSNKGTSFDVVFRGDDNKYHFETKLLGKHNVYNILEAIACGREFGIDIEDLINEITS